MNNVRRIIIILLMLGTLRSTPDVSNLPYCPPGTSSQPTLIVRDTPMRIRYTLVNNRHWTWIGFPELNDKIRIQFAQRVRIWYRIVYWQASIGSFFTRIVINGVSYNQFLHGVEGRFEHVMFSWDDVWLQKGEYLIAVQYTAQCTISDMAANHQSEYRYARLKIQYLVY